MLHDPSRISFILSIIKSRPDVCSYVASSVMKLTVSH